MRRREVAPRARRRRWLVLLAGLAVFAARAGEPSTATLSLARLLLDKGDFAGAAVEFHRLALLEADAGRGGGWRWMAAYAHWRGGHFRPAESLLDRIDRDSPELMAPTLLLRAEIARAENRPQEAAMYFEGFAVRSEDVAAREMGLRLALAARVEAGDRAGAAVALQNWPDAPREVAESVERYIAARDKHPWVGGALGLVPGLGYLYAGEYRNAAVSAALNGLFLWGMVESARDEHWAAFAFLSFFEFTWYAGSVLGAVEATERYNRRQAEAASVAVRGGVVWEPDGEWLPTIVWRIRF